MHLDFLPSRGTGKSHIGLLRLFDRGLSDLEDKIEVYPCTKNGHDCPKEVDAHIR
jgi:hypothetical protein